jgi:rhodanese-related sulfurtransferase
VAQILLDEGFPKAMPLQGGLEVWVKAGYPIEK